MKEPLEAVPSRNDASAVPLRPAASGSGPPVLPAMKV